MTADQGRCRELIEHVVAAGDPEAVPGKARFFKAGPGEYGEGDEFLGVGVPQLRRIARQARAEVTTDDVRVLLESRWHEVRQLAAFLLVEIYRRTPKAAGAAERDRVIEVLLDSTERLNNWDLVDAVAPYTLGPWLAEHPERSAILDDLVASPSLWRRRVAIVGTLGLIRGGRYEDTLRLAALVLDDPEDLIHKASGWMLREVGNRDRGQLNAFLDMYAPVMPRTMLRYAVEKHDPEERRRYLTARRRDPLPNRLRHPGRARP